MFKNAFKTVIHYFFLFVMKFKNIIQRIHKNISNKLCIQVYPKLVKALSIKLPIIFGIPEYLNLCYLTMALSILFMLLEYKNGGEGFPSQTNIFSLLKINIPRFGQSMGTNL